MASRVAALKFGGDLLSATSRAEGRNPVCGDVLHIALEITDDRIVAARWKATGCPPTLAAADILLGLVEGQSKEAALCTTADDVIALIEGLPPTSRHAVALAVDTLRSAIKG